MPFVTSMIPFVSEACNPNGARMRSTYARFFGMRRESKNRRNSISFEQPTRFSGSNSSAPGSTRKPTAHDSPKQFVSNVNEAIRLSNNRIS